MTGHEHIVYIQGELFDLETEELIEDNPTALEFLEMLDDYDASDDAYINAILREVYGRSTE
jgi:hypothetical protein